MAVVRKFTKHEAAPSAVDLAQIAKAKFLFVGSRDAVSHSTPPQTRALAMHAQVTAAIASPPAWDGHTTRAEEIRRYQGMIEGDRGMKHVHADYRPDGGTQIGGISTQTTSMTANWESETLFKDITQTLAKGAPPIRGAMPSHLAFRTA